ncbi:hypothetical protein SCP_1700190 [Sparassis crispa]|uniref:Uncharacterized protein n=1 Tax=Sparassis crispa TaxID=139825 RepID=A0A401H5I3_9APHY|nr:hypothetical protein SCP_1700190 [Sparassis crispa]GBE89695.1 hypothetical protein SCP_1700190 [Sparassis crispa]
MELDLELAIRQCYKSEDKEDVFDCVARVSPAALSNDVGAPAALSGPGYRQRRA